MKNVKNMMNKLAVSVVLATVLVAVSIPSNARNKSNKSTAVLNLEPAIKFVGNDGSASVFNINFTTEKPLNFALIIRNEVGEVLYNQNFESASFNKYVKFVNESGEEVKVTFTIRDLSTGAVKTYEAATSTTFVKTVSVTKI